MSRDRREFLRDGLAMGAVGVLGATSSVRASTAEHGSVSPDAMGVLVDIARCSGCRRCEAACAEANGLPEIDAAALEDPMVFEHRRRLGPDAFTVVNQFQRADTDDRTPVFAKSNCLHCIDPACVSACLVGALRKRPDGPVTYDAGKCMGCRYCMVACPFEIPTYEYAKPLTPRVRKCTFCLGNGVDDRWNVPACVKACPKECLIFGRREQLLAEAHERIARQPEVYVNHVFGEHEAGGTSWIYLSPMPFDQVGFLPTSASALPRLTESIQHGVFSHFMPPVAWCAILALTAWLTRTDRKPAVDGASAHGNGRAETHGAVKAETATGAQKVEYNDERRILADILTR